MLARVVDVALFVFKSFPEEERRVDDDGGDTVGRPGEGAGGGPSHLQQDHRTTGWAVFLSAAKSSFSNCKV